MADDDEEEKKVYSYEGARERGDVIEVTESAGGITKTENVELLGARSGKGKAMFPNNDVYEGEYCEGTRSGYGTYTYAAPPPADEDAEEEEQKPVAVYEGTWVDGEKAGVGTMTYGDGGKYRGAWVNGKRSGIGTFYYPNGDIYSGDWEDGKKHGIGTYIYKATQARLKATWNNGACVSGEFTDRHGNVYQGHFSGDATSIGYVHGGKFVLSSGAIAAAKMPVNTGFAKTGFCPVSYYGPKGPHVGSVDHPVTVHGVTYLLSAGAVDMFREDPIRFLPQFGGYCAVGVAFGKLVPVDPTNYKFVDDKLYLFSNDPVNTKPMFEADPVDMLAKANANWVAFGGDLRM